MQYLKILSALFVGVVVVIAILLLLSSFTLPGVPLDVRVVQTGSMEPAIRTGSIVFIMPSASYEIDEIITFHRDGVDEPVTHRLVSTRTEDGVTYFTTKGDANQMDDFREVREDEVLGTVRFWVPYIGYALTVARTPYGFIILVIIPALLLIKDEALKIRNEIRRVKKEEERDI